MGLEPRGGTVEPAHMRVAIAAVCPIVLFAALAFADVDTGYAPSADLVLRWTQTFGGGREVDRGPTVEVYDHGTVVVHFPPYMKRAGTYAMTLEPAEWQRLRRAIDDADVAGFDAERVADECEEEEVAARAAGTVPDLYEVHDAATSRLEVVVRTPRAVRGKGVGTVPVRSTVEASWYALGATAERHPGVAALRHLDRVEREMKTLLRDPRLVRQSEQAR